jgi:peroxiredoxin
MFWTQMKLRYRLFLTEFLSMVFDRSSINVGRTIQDFGLGDLTGVYRNTAKLRAKGWLVIYFFDATQADSAAVAETLKGWTTSLAADKVTILGVGLGTRESVEEFAKAHGLEFPVVWDYDEYVAATWSIVELPTFYVTNAGGKVLARITGADEAELTAAHILIADAIARAVEAARIAADKAAADAAAAPVPAKV